GTVVIGQPVAAKAGDDGLDPFRRGGISVADENPKAIPAQAARSQLVRVATDAEESDAVAIQLREPWFDSRRHGNHWPRDGVPVLEPGGTHVARPEAESLGDLAREVLGAHAAFLDPQVRKIAAAGWLVGRYFLDLEILRLNLDAAANPWQIGG